ncbi:uncharacterized protein METZ01_LOCUS401785, partial [marine metagenome]
EDGETFSSQEIQIYTVEELSNHGGTYMNYIYFKDNLGNKYRYNLGGVNSDELDATQQVINIRQRVKKYDGTGSEDLDENWEVYSSAESPQDLFQNNREYDIYYRIYDIAGNKLEYYESQLRTGQCHGCLEERLFDAISPSIIINGEGVNEDGDPTDNLIGP